MLFRAGDGLAEGVAALAPVAHRDGATPNRIEKSDGRFVMLHQGRLMPLLPTSPITEIADKPHPVLVITANNHTIGLLVEEIIDIVEDNLDVQLPSFTDDMVGSAQIKGNAVELIDVTYYLQAAYSSVYQQERKNILLVEDDLFFRDTLKPMLASAGYRRDDGQLGRSDAEISRHRQAVRRRHDRCRHGNRPAARNLARHLREHAGPADFPIFRLYEMPSNAVLGLPAEDRMTRNLSKLDRQNLLGTLASILAAQDDPTTSQGAGRMSEAALRSETAALAGDEEGSYFTVFVSGEIFGLPVENTHTIFRIASITCVPLSHGDIAGLVNLRGKIVTAVSLRKRLQMTRCGDQERPRHRHRAQGGEFRAHRRSGRRCALARQTGANPGALAFPSAAVAADDGLYRVGKLLIPVLDIEALFTFNT